MQNYLHNMQIYAKFRFFKYRFKNVIVQIVKKYHFKKYLFKYLVLFQNNLFYCD